MGAAGSALSVRTGRTRSSVTSRVLVGGGKVTGVVGSNLRHVPVHEKGMVVHGRPWLRVPTAMAQTGAGVDKYAGLSARVIPGAALVKSRAGKLWIIRRVRGKPVEWLYLLVKQVRLRARKPFEASLRRMVPRIRAISRDLVSSLGFGRVR